LSRWKNDPLLTMGASPSRRTSRRDQ